MKNQWKKKENQSKIEENQTQNKEHQRNIGKPRKTKEKQQEAESIVFQKKTIEETCFWASQGELPQAPQTPRGKMGQKSKEHKIINFWPAWSNDKLPMLSFF